MKKIYTLFVALIIMGCLMAQSPERFNYQAVVRGSGGSLIVNSEVGIKISILQGSTSGTAVCIEEFSPTTNDYGLVTLEIGSVNSIDIEAIDWSAGPYFVKIELDENGGTSYSEMGTSQLLSVPYALHAKTAASTFSGNYSDLSGAPTDVSTFTNDAGYLTTEVDGDVTNEIQGLSNVLAQSTDAGNNAMVNISQQGIGTASPDASAALEINSTTQGFLPPRMTSAERDAISTPATGLMIYNTDENKWQGVNGTVWVNIDGSSCIPDAPGAISGNTLVENNAADKVYSIASVAGATSYNWTVPAGATISAGQETTSITVTFGITNGNVSVRAENGCGNSTYTDLAVTVGIAIGDIHEGGILFYLDGTGQHGLVCAASDQSTGAEWGCYGTIIPGADGEAVGTGAQNTIDIETGCTEAGTAADICANLPLNGYDDWFLPSKDELDLMYTNLHLNGFGGFASADYWSSTEYNGDDTWRQFFHNGNQYNNYKYFTFRVRAVRAF